MGAVTYPSLEHVAAQARPYPTHVLEGAETGLILFAAAFLGHNDAVHFAEAGIATVCVDTDEARLHEMMKLYPWTWAWIVRDAWEVAQEYAQAELTFDVVSLDPFTGDTMRRCIEDLELWCSLARKAVVCGITSNLIGNHLTPEGWSASFFHRANDVYWLVLERP